MWTCLSGYPSIPTMGGNCLPGRFKTDNRAVGVRMNGYGYPRLGLRERRNLRPQGVLRERPGVAIPWWVACPYAPTHSSLATVSALEGLASEHGTHER